MDKGIQDIEELFDDNEKILKKENEAKKQTFEVEASHRKTTLKIT